MLLPSPDGGDLHLDANNPRSGERRYETQRCILQPKNRSQRWAGPGDEGSPVMLDHHQFAESGVEHHFVHEAGDQHHPATLL